MRSRQRYFCVHGHFYQPPRQDALTGIIPKEPGAHPFNNWNEKIHEECYKPNAEQGNFRRISFNLGPTLMQWMETYDEVTYRKIIEQEKVNFTENGVGNGMAQAYNHTILPLASRQDKITQVIWGIADYKHRYGHEPAGMWLPEAAVDMESLRIMADNGIKYTILAPWQASEQGIDTQKPYQVRLGNKKSIVVFFYQMDLSTRVSFDPSATTNADLFISDLVCPSFHSSEDGIDHPLLMIASDGELYGHHQPYREKFLSRLLDGASENQKISVTYPGLYLSRHKKLSDMKIREYTSWSCHHGVERWRNECDCTPGADWKAPLRKALEKTAQLLDKHYLDFCRPLNVDAWCLRNEYIRVMLGDLTWAEFLSENVPGDIPVHTTNELHTFMEIQIARQWMFTSCGWFFDDFDRIEPRNNVAYAAQAISRTERIIGRSLIDEVLPYFSSIRSSRTGVTGDQVFTLTYQKALQSENPFLDYIV